MLSLIVPTVACCGIVATPVTALWVGMRGVKRETMREAAAMRGGRGNPNARPVGGSF